MLMLEAAKATTVTQKMWADLRKYIPLMFTS